MSSQAAHPKPESLVPSTLPFDPAQIMGVRISQAEFARLCKVTRQAVSSWAKAGKITLFPDGTLDPYLAARQVFERTDPAKLRARVFRGAVAPLETLRARVRDLEAQLEGWRIWRESMAISSDDLAEREVDLLDTIIARFDELIAARESGGASALDDALTEISSACLWRGVDEGRGEPDNDDPAAEAGLEAMQRESGDLFSESAGAAVSDGRQESGNAEIEP